MPYKSTLVVIIAVLALCCVAENADDAEIKPGATRLDRGTLIELRKDQNTIFGLPQTKCVGNACHILSYIPDVIICKVNDYQWMCKNPGFPDGFTFHQVFVDCEPVDPDSKSEEWIVTDSCRVIYSLAVSEELQMFYWGRDVLVSIVFIIASYLSSVGVLLGVERVFARRMNIAITRVVVGSVLVVVFRHLLFTGSLRPYTFYAQSGFGEYYYKHI